MSLFDEIQKRLKKGPAGPTAADATAIQQEAQRVLAAKSGKAQTAGVPAASSVGAQAAAGGAQSALAQQRAQGAAQAQALGASSAAQQDEAALARERLASAGRTAQSALAAQGTVAAGNRQTAQELSDTQRSAQETETSNQLKFAADEAIAKLAAERKSSEREIFQTFKQGKSELAANQEKAELAQLLGVKALQDKEYTRELQEIGAQRRLEDSGNFNAEATRITLGDDMAKLIQQMGWKTAYDSDVRTWEEQMSAMGIDTAQRIADSALESAAQANYINGGVGILTAGGKYAASQPAESPGSSAGSSVGASAGAVP